MVFDAAGSIMKFITCDRCRKTEPYETDTPSDIKRTAFVEYKGHKDGNAIRVRDFCTDCRNIIIAAMDETPPIKEG